jgi:ribonucleoside-diphosphate reductase alpha chain
LENPLGFHILYIHLGTCHLHFLFKQVIYFGIKKEREEEEEKRKMQERDAQVQTPKKIQSSLPSSLRISQSKYVVVSETYSGGCKTCEL